MIPAEAVEAAARMLAETCDPLGDWDKQSESYRGIYRRRILPALQAAAPYMLAGAWGQGYLVAKEAIRQLDPINPYMLNTEGEK